MVNFTSCQNFVEIYLFLKKLCNFPFLPIYKDIDQYLEISCNFSNNGARAFKFCRFMPYMM